MSDDSGLQDTGGSNDSKMYRAGPDGGLEATLQESGDYRDRLISRRWNAAPLENPEAEPNDPRIAVGFIVGFSVLTFILLVAGYSTGFWG